MGMTVGGVTEVDWEEEISDADIIDYVLGSQKVLASIIDFYEPPAGSWAKAFADSDSVAQEQMLANLRLLCPYLNIEWKKA